MIRSNFEVTLFYWMIIHLHLVPRSPISLHGVVLS